MGRCVLVMITLLWSSFSFAQGFQSGSEFNHYTLHGRVHLTCMGNVGDRTTVYCDGYNLEPGTRDYFVHPEDINADKVKLTVIRPDGKERKQTKKYYSDKGRSKSFNLWIDTLFQNPLLHLGENTVSYKMKNGRDTVDEGSFEVYVNDLGSRQCNTRFMTSPRDEDCRFGGSSICSEYFYLENDCNY